MTQKNN